MTNTTLDTIKLNCAVIKKIQANVVLIEYASNYFVEIEDVIEVNKAYEQLANGGIIYSLLETKGKFVSFSKEAQQYLAKDAPIVKNKILAASAVVINSLPNRLFINFFLKFHKPNFPVKICKDKTSALEWINRIKK